MEPVFSKWPGIGICIGMIVTTSACVAGSARDTEATPAPVAAAKSSYDLGYEFGRQLQTARVQGGDVELESLLQGIVDGMKATGTDDAAAAAPVPPARKRGFKDDYARLNAERPGVNVLESGVQYEVLGAGDGPHPGPGDTVVVSYVGSLTNGTVFDSTEVDGGSTRMKLADIAIPGLREALLLMRKGDHWRVVIPPAMGFGRSGNNRLRRRDVIYDITLQDIEKGG